MYLFLLALYLPYSHKILVVSFFPFVGDANRQSEISEYRGIENLVYQKNETNKIE